MAFVYGSHLLINSSLYNYLITPIDLLIPPTPQRGGGYRSLPFFLVNEAFDFHVAFQHGFHDIIAAGVIVLRLGAFKP
jgi:hypothetical protein